MSLAVPDPLELMLGVCFAVAWGFAADTTVIRQAADGSNHTVAMKDLAVNDTVLVASDNGAVAWDTVYLLVRLAAAWPLF